MQRRTTGSILKVRCISLGPPSTILLFGVGIRRRVSTYLEDPYLMQSPASLNTVTRFVSF